MSPNGEVHALEFGLTSSLRCAWTYAFLHHPTYCPALITNTKLASHLANAPLSFTHLYHAQVMNGITFLEVLHPSVILTGLKKNYATFFSKWQTTMKSSFVSAWSQHLDHGKDVVSFAPNYAYFATDNQFYVLWFCASLFAQLYL